MNTYGLDRETRRQLRDAKPDDPITLYTRQHNPYWEDAHASGFVRGHILKSDYYEEDPNNQRAYHFMIDHMQKQMPYTREQEHFSPIWTWPLQRPHYWNRDADYAHLKLSIPRKRIIFSVFHLWEDVMFNQDFLTRGEILKLSRDAAAFDQHCSVDPHSELLHYKSRWNDIFDIVDVADKNYFTISDEKDSLIIQACIDHIDLKSDVIEYNEDFYDYTIERQSVAERLHDERISLDYQAARDAEAAAHSDCGA